jgi:hypothetical protein
MQKTQPSINCYKFGLLNVAVLGMGVYFGGKHLDSSCDALSLAELKQANREAWKQFRKANALANRVSNITTHGSLPYESAFQHAMVAEAVCKATWKKLRTH